MVGISGFSNSKKLSLIVRTLPEETIGYFFGKPTYYFIFYKIQDEN